MPPLVRLSPRVLPRAVQRPEPEELVIGAADLLRGQEEQERREQLAAELAREEREDVQRFQAGQAGLQREHDIDVITRQGRRRMSELATQNIFEREMLGTRLGAAAEESALDRELRRDIFEGEIEFRGEEGARTRELQRELGLFDMNAALARINADLLLGRDGRSRGSMFPLASSVPGLLEDEVFGHFGVDPLDDILRRASEFAAGGFLSGSTMRTPPQPGGTGGRAGGGISFQDPGDRFAPRMDLQQHLQMLPHITDQEMLEEYILTFGIEGEDADLLRERFRGG